MRINSIRYRDKIDEWELSEINFFNLTLLVGISGVGKTQILESILNLKNIANGNSQNGIEWEISFTNDVDDNYIWKGEFETLEHITDSFLAFFLENKEEEAKPKILEESISLNNEIIAIRQNNEIIFQGDKMPKLSSEESLISIFKEEDSIKSAYLGFKKIVFRDHTQKEGGFRIIRQKPKDIYAEYKSFEDIRNSDLGTIQKLMCLYENQREAFNDIVENYIDVFPQIESVKLEPIADYNISSLFSDLPMLHFKEKGVEKWILQNRMSSGMLRTFLHISEMHLLSEGTVVLIDEFENSLGVNCIDVLTEDLIFENSRLQFIATSHHPYIINKIPYDYWKIITRQGGEIKTFDAKDFDLGESSHERFINLINLPQYRRGIESL